MFTILAQRNINPELYCISIYCMCYIFTVMNPSSVNGMNQLNCIALK